MPDAVEHYTLKVGDTFLARFRLRKRGQRDYWNGVGATAIVLEWWLDGVAGTPIVANSGHVQADWGAGYVPIQVDPTNVTAMAGSVTAVVRIEIDGESVALPHDGHILFEIQPRGEP